MMNIFVVEPVDMDIPGIGQARVSIRESRADIAFPRSRGNVPKTLNFGGFEWNVESVVREPRSTTIKCKKVEA